MHLYLHDESVYGILLTCKCLTWVSLRGYMSGPTVSGT